MWAANYACVHMRAANNACVHTRAAKCGDGGFTIIELLIAFVILAIVSGSLFQIFYVSSQNNAKTLAFIGAAMSMPA